MRSIRIQSMLDMRSLHIQPELVPRSFAFSP
jgi:hypothetical protein